MSRRREPNPTPDEAVAAAADADHVEPLQEPTPAPWTEPTTDAVPDVDELGGDEPAGEPAPLTDDELAGILAVVVPAPFDWTGAAIAGRLPGDPPQLRADVRAVWRLAPDEADTLAHRLAAAVPARFRSSRVLAASPLLVALGDVALMVRSRLAATSTIVAAYTTEPESSERDTEPDRSPAGAGRPAARGARRPGGRPADAVPRPAPPTGAPASPDGWAGAGLAARPAIGD